MKYALLIALVMTSSFAFADENPRDPSGTSSAVNADSPREPAADTQSTKPDAEVKTEVVKVVNTAENKPVSEASLDDVIDRVLKTIVDKTRAAKGRVAVMDFPSLETGRLTALSANIANKAGNRLIEANRSVVDRGALEKIISEQKLQQNALMDAATAAKVGRLAGAGVFIIGNYSVHTKKFSITVRALSVETGQFIAAAEESAVLNTDLKAEIDDLQSRQMATSSAPGADLAAPADAAPDAKSQDKNGAEFDKQVCAAINKNTPFLKYLKMGFDKDIVDINQMGERNLPLVEHQDAAGENRYFAFQIGNWWFSNQNSAISRSEVGAAYKGNIAHFPAVQAWLYEGTAPLSGCISKPGWWTTERPFAAKPKKKK